MIGQEPIMSLPFFKTKSASIKLRNWTRKMR